MKKSLISSVILSVAILAGSVLMAEAGNKANVGPVARTPVGTLFGSAMLWAVINSDGSIARSDGAAASTTAKLAGFTGAYKVGFFRNVRGCAYIATVGGSTGSGTPPNGFVVVEGRFDNVNGVFVQTADSGGSFADRGFHLFVNC